MAKTRAKTRTKTGTKGSWRFWLVMLVIMGLGVLAWTWRAPALGYAQTGAAYSARVACSCRYVAGRSMQDCAKDKLSGMELITLVEDSSTRSVTARFPLLAAETAVYRDGYGCVLETWED